MFTNKLSTTEEPEDTFHFNPRKNFSLQQRRFEVALTLNIIPHHMFVVKEEENIQFCIIKEY